MNRKIWAGRAALAILGAVFLAAGALKVADPLAFADDIYRYRLVDWTWSLVLALYLPWLEVVAALALVAPSLRRAAVALIAGLCGVFLVALVSAEVRGLRLSCGCFGEHGIAEGLGWAIVRDLALLAVAAAYLILSRGSARGAGAGG